MSPKKTLAMLLATIMLLALVAGCAPSAPVQDPVAESTPTPAQKPADPPAETGNEDVSIEIWIVQTDWLDAWDEMKSRFETAYPHIELINVGTGEKNNEFFVNRLAAQDLPSVCQVDNTEAYRAAVDEGKFLDLSSRPVAGHVADAYKAAFTHNGTLFGITQGSAFSVLYLNMAILEQAGWTSVPTNWDEFIQCCDDIKTKTDASPLTLAGDKTTTCWMLYELIIANAVGETLGFGEFENQMRAGTFDFTAYPEIAEHLAQIAPYMMPGTSGYTEDDVTAIMTDGTAAMCIAGNWTANNICTGIEALTGDLSKAKAIIAPFNAAGVQVWNSVSPETAFGISAHTDPAKQEAAELFFDWVFQPENYSIIQNARGIVPVIDNMGPEHIILPEPIKEVLPASNAAPYVLMGFNLWTDVFKDAACTGLKDVYAGNKQAADVVAAMTETLKGSFVGG